MSTAYDIEVDVDKLIRDHDDTFMALPDIEFEPHQLISKVRKHYMEYMIKILSVNYETNQKLLNKNIYLPSAIWKCAKNLEMKAAQTCMMVQIYRKCIVAMINEVKTDTKRGRLYNKLYESLHLEPRNEKKTQTSVTMDNCQCSCNDKKRRRKRAALANVVDKKTLQNRESFTQRVENFASILEDKTPNVQKIPVVTNMCTNMTSTQLQTIPVAPNISNMQLQNAPISSMSNIQLQNIPVATNMSNMQVAPINTVPEPLEVPKPKENSDELMLQLEKLFQNDNDEDLFENSLFGTEAVTQNTVEEVKKMPDLVPINSQDSIIENHAAQIKSLDQRLATLTGLLSNNEQAISQQQQRVVKKSKQVSKWHAEEYYLKKSLFELLYQIGDNNRKKLSRIKQMYIILFGEDSDDEEDIVSPDDSLELVASCKHRIDGWVMAVLAPYYAKGRIMGKGLYKAVARHLIDLIYKCKPYPSRHEVTSFVMDFLENRGRIRCEADFKEFRIDNVQQVPNYSFICPPY